MLRWFRSWSMATKQFLLLFLVTFVLFAVLAASNYNRAVELFRSRIVDDAATLMNRTNQFLDSYLDNGQNILMLLSTRTDMLASSEEKDITDFLRTTAETNLNLVKTLYIVRTDGKVFSSSQVFYEVLGNPALPKLVEQALPNYSAMVSQPYVSPQSGRTVAIARPMLDKRNERVGVAVVELDLDRLYRKLVEFSPPDQTFVLLSDKGRLVLHDGASGLLPGRESGYRTELSDELVASFNDLSIGTDRYEGPAGPLVTLRSGQNRLGWSLILFMKESYFYQGLSDLNDNYKTAGAAMFVALLLAAFVMSRFATRPIRMLALRMDRVNDMVVVPSITVRREDEIGRLARSFNAMMERIRGLLDETKRMETRKKELELKVLQSQISPHFLYNTLACIGSLARQQRTDEVGATIRALVGVLKLTFDRTSEFVRVEEELEALRQYVLIQKTRYGDKFRFECDVEGGALGLKVLKLTLQPIVENAIFHGILPASGQGDIRVRGTVRGGVLRFVVRDNGVGMKPGLAGPPAHAAKERFTGIGMTNVHERIRLRYGEPYGLRFRSVRHAGTVVVLTLPAVSAAE
ncbi:cache domain-containing sensor histidine kinase [Paenibacillus flagellatus]|nr:sensor histidine kinase [Paenibacillus flagellatus]